MNRVVVAISVYVVATVAADVISVHCPVGCPTSPTTNDLIHGHIYALSNNPTTKFADWVAYEVDIVNFGPSPGRDFKADPRLDDDETLEKNEYTGANADPVLQADRGAARFVRRLALLE